MTVYAFDAVRIDGAPQSLEDYKGQVLLVVNTASFCGFTPQFEGLEALYQSRKDRGLTILGFPCNQFGKQDPHDNAEIGGFCQKNYGVTFPMFEKVEVNGPDAHPLYNWLKSKKPGIVGTRRIKWNFTKFLIGKDGNVVKRYPPTTKPEDIAKDIDKLLAA